MHSFTRKVHIVASVLVLTLLWASACQEDGPHDYSYLPTVTPATPTATPPTGDPPAAQTSAAGPGTVSESAAAPTATGTPQVLADWRDAPILPETISARLLDIYRDGQAQGRDPHAFSVIGDCQAIPFVFLGPFARGQQAPGSSEGHLYEAIDYFSGSFNRSGMAVRGGFTAASILNPVNADPHDCLAGETPLTCEYRLHNPAFVFITLETWLDPETVDRYEIYLRQILDYVIARGSVPILLTKADSSEATAGRHVINPILVRLAYEYQVPLVNFWRAAQYLDNYGIDRTREGFHLSPEGYELKNLLALRALYMVWKAVEGQSGAALPGATPEATPAAARPVEVTQPDCRDGCVFFGTILSHDGLASAGGVYAFQVSTGGLTRVLGKGFDLQDASEDGTRLLVNESNRLYEIDLAADSSLLLSDTFAYFGKQGAFWDADDSQVTFLDQANPIQTDSGPAIDLFPAAQNGELYFASGTCTGQAICQPGGVYRIETDRTLTRLDSRAELVFSPDGSLIAFLNPAAATADNYYHIPYMLLEDAGLGLVSRRTFYFPAVRGFMVNPDVRTYAFSPNGNWLFILYDVYSDYFEKSLRLQTYLLDIDTGILYDYGRIDGPFGSLNPQLAWSPDGSRVLFFLTNIDAEGRYTLDVYQTNLQTGERLAPYSEGSLTSSDYFYITNIYWR